MTTLTVGTGQEFTTIAAAVAASSSGDTINVDAGTYTNDFVSISHDLTLNAVGGTVTMVATEQPPNGKAIIDEGGSGVSVTINGFDMSGATVADGNGAAIRYEGGNLTLNGDTIHDNQEGLLAADDPNGTITIDNSTFADNGSGTGYTHNIYVGDIASLTVENSTITGAVGGHDIKSRAENTTIVGNTITDGASGTGSYEIDLPNGGNATISGNVIEKGADATNPNAISFGEEGGVYASSSLTVQGNTILNDDTSHSTTAVVNDTSVTAAITGNSLYGWSSLSSGAVTASDNTTLSSEPSLSSLVPTGTTTASTTPTDPATSTSTTDTSSATSGTTGSTTTAATAAVTTSTVGSTASPGFLTGGDAATADQAVSSSTPSWSSADLAQLYAGANGAGGSTQTTGSAYGGTTLPASGPAAAWIEQSSTTSGHHYLPLHS